MYGQGEYSSIEFTDSDISCDSEDAAEHARAPSSAAAASAATAAAVRRGRQTTKASNPSRQAANQRERRRMRSINEAFDFLRKHVPQTHCQKKLSKVDTLRFAIDYIRQLDEVIRQDAEAKAHLNVDANGSKVFINCNGAAGYAVDGFSPVSGLALSWRNEKQFGPEQLNGGRTCVAKIWTPTDPGKVCSAGVRFDDDDAAAGDGGCDRLLERLFERDQLKKLLPAERFPSHFRSESLDGLAAMPARVTARGLELS